MTQNDQKLPKMAQKWSEKGLNLHHPRNGGVPLESNADSDNYYVDLKYPPPGINIILLLLHNILLENMVIYH